jgi:hypothetical protein
VDLSTAVKAHVDAYCPSEPEAKRVNEMLRGLLGIARLTTPQNRPEMLRVYDGVKVAYKQQLVTMDANIPLDLIDTLVSFAAGARKF